MDGDADLSLSGWRREASESNSQLIGLINNVVLGGKRVLALRGNC